MNSAKRICAAFSGFLFVIAVFTTQKPATAQTLDDSLLRGLKWRLVGPFRGGRVLAVTGVAGDPNSFYFGAVAGGVWKTTNAGVTWVPIFDKEPIASIGSIAVAPSDANVIYVGTGEACIRGNISFGNGVYKSVDAGKTWTHVGLEDTRHIGRVIVDPRNPDVVFVAALGHAYGANTERGVFRSTDGGKNWQKVLYKDEKTGAIDITFDPTNAHILYAALWQAVRTPWSLESGGPGSGLYKSSDGGAMWVRLEGHGLPKGVLGRIGVAVGADGNRVYALIEAEEGGVYRSDDAGETWQKINDDHRFRQRAWYFTHIFADPKHTDTVYILNTGAFRSTDGGQTFSLLPAPHGDHHGLWIDPTDPNRMINGNDGGATISVDGGKTWSRQNNQPTAQFYHIAADNDFFYHLYGAQQDNSTVAIASRTDHGYIGEQDWYPVGGGESGYIVADPRNSNIVYAGDNGGTITRFDKSTGQVQDISVWPEDYSGHGVGELKHRFQWTAPIAFSPFDPDTLYQGGEVLFKTTNAGKSWTAISPDLTRNDKSKQVASGGPITKDNTSVEYYDTIFAVTESPVEKGLIWAGSDDGLVQMTRDAGKNWTNVTPKDLPEWSRINLIEPSPFDAGTAYVAGDHHKQDDYRPYIYKTTDYGKTWVKVTNGLPDHSYVLAVREDPVRKGLLYAGTETTIYVSFDDGAHWQSLQLNLPITPIDDLGVHGDNLILATHGRSFWILDDITPLREANAKISSADFHLYKPRLGWRTRTGGTIPDFLLRWYGENAPGGADLNYYLKAVPKSEVTVEILDASGGAVRKLSSKSSRETTQQQEWPEQARPSDLLPAAEGLNRFTWDLRVEPPRTIPGYFYSEGDTVRGPFVPPGNYQVRMTVEGKSETQPLELRLDPRLKASPDDLAKQYALARQIRDKLSEVTDTILAIRSVRGQLDALKRRIGSHERSKEIAPAAGALDKSMAAIEDVLTNPHVKATEDDLNYPVRNDDRLSGLLNSVESADTAPTEQELSVYEKLSLEADGQITAWKNLVTKDLAALNELILKNGIEPIAPAAAAKQ